MNPAFVLFKVLLSLLLELTNSTDSPERLPLGSTMSCRACGGGPLEYQEASGDTVCTVCGTVAEESNIVAAVEFVENGGGATSVVGQYLSATASRPYGNSGPGYGPSKESREVRFSTCLRDVCRAQSSWWFIPCS